MLAPRAVFETQFGACVLHDKKVKKVLHVSRLQATTLRYHGYHDDCLALSTFGMHVNIYDSLYQLRSVVQTIP